MVERNYFHILSDEEKAKYKFGFCEGCPFYECELVGEYTQFRESHAKINKPLIPAGECVDADSFGGGTVNQGTAVSVECNGEDSNIYSTNSCPIIDTDSSDVESLSYDQSKLKNCCVMNRNIYQVECGRKKVTEGIGNHYKIEITEELKKDCLSRKK